MEPKLSNQLITPLEFLRQTISTRLKSHFSKDLDRVEKISPVRIEDDGTALSSFVIENDLCMEEYTALLIALVPHVQPTFFESIIQEFLPNGGDFPDFGAIKASNQRSILPTGETVLFILAGHDVRHRLRVQQLFGQQHLFHQNQVIWLETVKEGEPAMSGALMMASEWVDKFLFGIQRVQPFGPDFPARYITTQMNWDDLVLHPKTEQQINDIKTWLDHNDTFLKEWEMGRKIKPGYWALFCGPSGTGKTLTASLLGKQFSRDVYRIDLSQVVSKYIGETEKNLEKIFQKAENKNWILFFDEADALFGKRSNVQNAHDKYANQETSYLLQREVSGLVILASNFKDNIDKAFLRRFNAIINFPAPNATERAIIWSKSIPRSASISRDVDPVALSNQYDLTGSAIINVIHYASLQAIRNGTSVLTKADLVEGIKREYEKEEKVFSN